jgi:ferredoxin
MRFSLKDWFTKSDEIEDKQAALGRVVPDASRCVQCGVCGYNCPVGIPVRDYARQGMPVSDATCISCGNCVNVCPRGTLRWETENHQIVLERFAEQMGQG